MLGLLDTLYGASEKPDPFSEMVLASDLFFFSQSGKPELAGDIPASLDDLASFRAHIERLQKGLSQDAVSATPVNPGDRLANIWIHLNTGQITGNAPAELLLDRSLPADLAALPFAPETQREIRALIKEARAGSFAGSKVLPISVEHRDDVMVARCLKLDSYAMDHDTDPRLQLTVSFIAWSPDMLAFAEREFGLTQAETQVLSHLLSGASQSDVADRQGKSRETVKAQAKSILRKFGAAQMSEVQATALAYAYLGAPGLVDTLDAPRLSDRVVSFSRMVPVGQGREVQVFEYGAKDGQPVLFWHGLILGPFFTPNMIEQFRTRGLRVIGISRPGFGRSAPPQDWAMFNRTVTEDTVKVVDHLRLDQMCFWVHQAGISFACRAAGALKGRVKGAAMNGAGVPIAPHMLREMNRTTRVAAATVVHAPQLLELMLNVGFRTWRKTGPVAFYREFFGRGGVEQQTLEDPEFAKLFELGFLHTSAQHPKAMVRDGMSAMSDWSAEFDHFDFPQHWMHGDSDQILDARFVAAFLEARGLPPLILREGFGSDLLYRDFDYVISETSQFFHGLNPVG